MADALKNSGREIFYSLCQWGNQFPWFWADQFADSYRMSGDIKSSFAADSSGVCQTAYCLNTGYAGVSVLTMIRKMRELSRFQKPGSWGEWPPIISVDDSNDVLADMDMLEIGTGTMNLFQEQTHFSFWAALKSPLIIGADVTKIKKESLDVMLNKEVIYISQDDAGVAVNYLPDISIENKTQVWAGPLSSGNSRHVILALNYGANATDITIPLHSIPDFDTTAKYTVRDVWAGRNLCKITDTLVLKNVSVHETKVLVFSE